MKAVKCYLMSTMVLLGASSHADLTYNATLQSDTFISHVFPDTNYEADGSMRFMQMRSASAATRSSFVQFSIPAMNPALITNAVLTLRAGTTSSGYPDVEVVATTNAVDLTTITWNNAISGGLLTGTGRESDYTMAWSGAWTLFAQPLVLGAVSASDPTGGSIITYSSSNLVHYLQSQASESQAVIVTLALGFAAEETSSGIQFRTENDSGTAYVESGGPYAPTLQIQAIPEPSSGLLLLISTLTLGVWSRIRRRG